MATLNDRMNQMQYRLKAGGSYVSSSNRGGQSNRLLHDSVPMEPDQQAASSTQKSNDADRRNLNDMDARTEIRSQEIGKNWISVNLTAEHLIQGMILSEVLGRPVSKRRGRGRIYP